MGDKKLLLEGGSGGQRRERTIIILIAFLIILVLGQIIGFEYYYSHLVVQSSSGRGSVGGDIQVGGSGVSGGASGGAVNGKEKNVLTTPNLRTNEKAVTGNRMEEQDISNNNNYVAEQEVNVHDIVDDGEGLRSAEEVLQAAGVEVTDEMRDMLPPKQDTLQMYGSKPVFYGLERCEEFRTNTDLADAFIGVAGMFNSGTNLLSDLLVKNCYIPEKVEKYGLDKIGMRDIVPWGKHTPVSWRFNFVADVTPSNVSQANFLAAVVVKDPYPWMESMCRHKYEANWRHFKGHCPNLVPISAGEENALDGEESVEIRIRYRPTNITHHESLAHLWNKWYQDYVDADFPRLMIRFEDLLFHAEEVVTKVCNCGGGVMRDGGFKYIKKPAKAGPAHQGSSGLLKSLAKYGDASNRLKSFTTPDLDFAKSVINKDIMRLFKYAEP